MIRATYLVAASLNVDVVVVKVPCCSDRGSVLSDLISKGQWSLFRSYAPEYNYLPTMPPTSLVKFIGNPQRDRNLGVSLTNEMKANNIKIMKGF